MLVIKLYIFSFKTRNKIEPYNIVKMSNISKVKLWEKRMDKYNKKNNGVELSLNAVEDSSLVSQIKSLSSITMRVFNPTTKDCQNQRYRCINGTNMNKVFKKIKQIGVSSVNGVVFYTEVGKMRMVMKTPVSIDADDPEYEYHIHKLLMNKCIKYIPNIPLVYFGFTCSQTQEIAKIKKMKTAKQKIPNKYKANVPFCLDISNNNNKEKFGNKYGTFFIASQFIDNPQVLYEVSDKAKNFKSVIDIMVQATCALMVAQQRTRFSHYDLHQGNIMVSPMKNDSLFCYATHIKDMPYIFVESPFLCYLIDFGRSYVSDKELYYDPNHKEKNYDPFTPAITPNKYSGLYDVISIWIYPIISEAKAHPRNKYLQDFALLLESIFEGALDTNLYYHRKPIRTPGYRNQDGSREDVSDAFDLLYALKTFGYINVYTKSTGKTLYLWNRDDIKGELGVITDDVSNAIFDYEESLKAEDVKTMNNALNFLNAEFDWMKTHKKPRTPTPTKTNTTANKIIKGMPPLNMNKNYNSIIAKQRSSFTKRYKKCMKQKITDIKKSKVYKDLPRNIGKSKMKKKELCSTLSKGAKIISTIDSQRTVTDPIRPHGLPIRPHGLPIRPPGLLLQKRKSQKIREIMKGLKKIKKVKKVKRKLKLLQRPVKKSSVNVKKNCNKMKLKDIKKTKAYKDLPRKFGKSKKNKKDLCRKLME